MDRRSFVKNACLGSAALYFHQLSFGLPSDIANPQVPRIELRGLPQKPSPLGMPGLFPGRVVEISSPDAIVRNRVSQPLIKEMLDHGMKRLTGETSAQDAWAKFVDPKDIIGIKINPSGAPACCSSPEIVREIVAAVQSVGVPARNIIIYDRYAYEIDIGSYQALVPPEVKVVGIQDAFTGASGYDMNIYCDANFFGEWETRSYMASIVAHGVSKIINVPTMKDHSAAGVTGCLKNLGYGTFNNVARSHRQPYSFTDPLIGMMCSVEPLRSKAVLHIMDGMRLVWHGGPLTQVQDFIYPAGKMYIGTDPVAMDTIELKAIEEKRQQEGVPSVWEHDPSSITSNDYEFFHDPRKNLFYRRPGHIASAGKLGLGVADPAQIDHLRIS
ncbi:MAG TPA: DUF362 domain-containing protein [Terriglobales bacterium]|jgi:uncharacterized protein (DUF362 family)|nr:DUF362 domain-containing protein [Terriglobales bacterium]